jgi:hypothetical protein
MQLAAESGTDEPRAQFTSLASEQSSSTGLVPVRVRVGIVGHRNVSRTYEARARRQAPVPLVNAEGADHWPRCPSRGHVLET